MFYRSRNNVILSPGYEHGIIPPTFFSSATRTQGNLQLLAKIPTIPGYNSSSGRQANLLY